jgi:hypothetical protein
MRLPSWLRDEYSSKEKRFLCFIRKPYERSPRDTQESNVESSRPSMRTSNIFQVL